MRRIKPAFIIAALLFAIVCVAEERVRWLDFDMKNIPEPKERKSGYYDYFFKGQLIEGAKQQVDVVRWTRVALGKPRQSTNVNALDEVPDSSWYTNRHRIHPMTADALQGGPNRGNPPDLTSAIVTKAKTGGVSPGMMLKDATGESYLIKFDGATYPNLQSGAEVITTKILYAAGYNVPENYVAYLHPDNLKIADDVKITDAKTGQPRQLTRDDIDEMLRRAARTPDGQYRVLASKILKGKVKGPFPQIGFRSDDPNDLIPHEDRRELRGFRVIASWINDWDLKEAQSMDMYVEENGRKFLRHYLLDFGSSLGADTVPTEYFHGHEYGLDVGSITKEILSLGLYKSANEKLARIVSPEIGNFTADEFEPGGWKPTYPSVMFSNLTDLDAFWSTRIVLSFTENDLRSIIQTAEYASPMSNDYILHTLLERQRILAAYWLARVDGLSEFAVKPEGTGVSLSFRDLMVDHKLASADSTEYEYQVKGINYKSAKKRVGRPEISIDRETLAAAVEHGGNDGPVEVRIWPRRVTGTSEPVSLYFNWSPRRDVFAIHRISRG